MGWQMGGFFKGDFSKGIFQRGFFKGELAHKGSVNNGLFRLVHRNSQFGCILNLEVQCVQLEPKP